MNTMNQGNQATMTGERIVSVNDYGPSRRSWLRPLAIVVIVITIAVVGTVRTAGNMLKHRRAEHDLNTEQAKHAHQPQTPSRRTFPELAPARPAMPAVEVGAQCGDGSSPTAMLARDGSPILTPGGLPVRLCRNGQVLMPPLPTPESTVMPVSASTAAPPSPATTGGAKPTASRYDGDLVLPAGAASADSYAALPALAPQPAEADTAQDAPADPRGALRGLLRTGQSRATQARLLADRDLILPQGRTIDCNLSLRLVSEVAGQAVCVLSSYVYGDSGLVVLAEPGSVATGTYVALSAPGQRRVFITWERLKTAKGVVIDIASPAADSLGTSGLDGYLDNRWADRIGAAVLLSSVQDVVGYETARAGSSNSGGATGIAIFPQTTRTGQQLAERILDSTINIKPTLYKRQGDRATISVVRDLDFGSVYELRAE